MTQEEKAKAYDRVSKEVKDFFEGRQKMYSDINQTLEYLFPELKESEDEKIRNIIIRCLKGNMPDNDYRKECITWLEKQGEKTKPIEGFDTEFERQISHLIASAIDREHEYNEGYVKWTANALLEYAKREFEKQCEQKSTDNLTPQEAMDIAVAKCFDEQQPFNYENVTIQPKDFAPRVEPKFKKGDWITDGYLHYKITDVLEDRYIVDTKFVKRSAILFNNESRYHLWSIEDAKDGDVLIDKSHVGECVFIFKEARSSDIKTEVSNPLAIIGYCGINHIGFTSQLSGLGFGDTANCIYYPATKEQRDLLFQKMHESGYEWDAEKKELKKIDWNPQPGDTFRKKGTEKSPIYHLCNKREDGIHFGFVEERENGVAGGEISIFALKNEYELVEMSKPIEKYIEEEFNKITELKPSWSKEDERMVNHIIGYLHSGDDFQTGVDWLKSLKDRYTWRPSEEQMKVLDEILNYAANHESPYWHDYILGTLNSLIRQLKKLKA